MLATNSGKIHGKEKGIWNGNWAHIVASQELSADLWGRVGKWGCLSMLKARLSSRLDTSATMECSLGPTQSRQPGLLRRLISCAATANSKAVEPGSPA